MGHVARLIVGRVEIADAAFQAGIHDSEVLIGQRQVHHQVGIVTAQQGAEFLHRVGVDTVGLNHRGLASMLFGLPEDGLLYGVAFLAASRGEDYPGEHIGILGALVGGHCADTSDANDNNFCHF